MRYINSITEAIGNTPLLKLNKIYTPHAGNVFVKLENLNPSGSYKDRMALAMVEAAEKGLTWNGKKLPPNGIVVEASAGNTAPALAMVCAAKGYKARFVLYRYMFEGEVNTRLLITKTYGPEVTVSSEPSAYLTPEETAAFLLRDPDLPHVLSAKMDCAIMEQMDPNCVWVDQIYNSFNYKGQMEMAREICEQLDGKIDGIGCSVGAGGSLYGLCKGLAHAGVKPRITFGIVPVGSENYLELDKKECDRQEFRVSDLSTDIARAMGLEKWLTEDSIVKQMVQDGYPDLFFRVSAEEARAMADRLVREEGIYCGMSSGANVAISLKIAERLGEGANVVTTIVDRRDRYLSEIPNEKYVV